MCFEETIQLIQIYIIGEAIPANAKLVQSGVPVHFYRYSRMAHAFFEHTGEFPQAEDCTNEMAKLIQAVRSVLPGIRDPL